MATIEEGFAAYKAEAERKLQAANAATAAAVKAVDDTVKVAQAEAVRITEVCASVGRLRDAAGHIAAGRTMDQVATMLLQGRAFDQERADATISTVHGIGGRVHTDPSDPQGWAASTRRVCGHVRELPK